ncbi:MAG: Transcriptional regulator [Microbacterium sp.]|jgi:transcriptional regulator GlxA family with amidase domain|uniref:GlxA family transcriptional regulator n=1 Tax=Microbacterium sp. TaxID=51671 RepID=UPI00262F6BF8|nr:helix-turn-helix domain-containing protein [Microbacterium sp.]MDF2558967.1 Transcriptional regulator [Microbacterium sp.]
MAAPRVTVIAVEGISPFHLSVPSLVWGGETPAGEIEPWPIRVAAIRAGTLRTSTDFDIEIRHGLEAVRGADIVVVPWWGDPERAAPDELSLALRDARDEGAELVGLCLGAFPLADSGVLDGHTATTHWRWADVFRQRFPLVDLEPDELYVDEGSIVTGAGATAGIDACLHLLARREGQHVANRVARRIVAPPHRAGGQAQFIERPVLAGGEDPVAEAMRWSAENLAADLSIDSLAVRAHLSRSSFTRAFRTRTGSTVAKWVLAQRLAAARELLETTSLPIDAVAESTGFGGAAVFRQHFGRAFGATPSQYRSAFRAI